MTERKIAMTKSENRDAVEMHGCIVCARLFNVLAIYNPDGKFINCTVTSAGGHRVPDEHHPLVACDTHSAGEIEAAYQRWLSNRTQNAK
ncbi:MAG TPA: hypothetical protein VF338_12140 [Leptolinea sp.]